MEGAPTRDNVAEDLLESFHQHDVHRVIVAVSDRRGAIPWRSCSAFVCPRSN